MAIIELAHVKLQHGTTVADATLLQNMAKVTAVIEAYNHLRNLFYVEVDDPSILYVIGAWASREQHQHGFNGSPEQGKILELVRDQMDIDWMYYVDVEQAQIPLDAPVLEIKRYFLHAGGDKKRFSDALLSLTEGKSRSGGTGGEGSVGAWNLPKSDGEEVLWVQFTGWKSVEDYREHSTSHGDDDDRAVADMVEKIDFRFATRVHL